MFPSMKAVFALAIASLTFSGCKPAEPDTAAPTTTPIATHQPVTPSKAALARAIRIDAGSTKPLVDADGYTWQPDSGFNGGGMVDRGNIQIANTRNPALYRT